MSHLSHNVSLSVCVEGVQCCFEGLTVKGQGILTLEVLLQAFLQ